MCQDVQHTISRKGHLMAIRWLCRVIISLLSTPKRLKRMLLRRQIYDIEVTHVPGHDMVLADTLSRAHLPESTTKWSVEAEIETTDMVNYLPISEERFRTILLQEKTKNCRHWSKPRLVKISLAMTRLLHYRWLVLKLLGNRLPAWHKSSTVIKNSRLILPCRVSGTLLFQIMGHSTHPKNFSDSAKCGSLSTKPHPLGIHKAMVRQSTAWKLKKICCWKLKQQVKTLNWQCWITATQ